MKRYLFKTKVSMGWSMYVRIISIFVVYAVIFILFQHGREKHYRIDSLNKRLQDCNVRLYRSADNLTQEEFDKFSADSDPKLRITVIREDGKVIYDNILKNYESLPDHSGRKEIAGALKNGRSYVIDRLSATTQLEYFYSATYFKDKGIIVRTALPYGKDLSRMMRSDMHFLWITIATLVLLSFVLRVYVGKLDSSINKDKAESNSLTRKQLTQNISHELKTPVASVLGYLETITEHPDMNPETRNEFLRHCLSQTRRLSSLLTDLSVLNKMWDAPQSWTFSRIDVAKIISDLAGQLYPQIKEKGFVFEDNVTGPVELNGNQTLVYSVFRNLLDNALAYSGGSVIKVSVSDEGEFWHFCFRDNGIGVGEEHLTHLFDRFYRVDEGRSRRTGGTGLGLAIVKNAVQLHGGSISVRNDKGLVFDFTLKKM